MKQTGISLPRLERADSLITRFIDEGRLPGAVTLVSKDGAIVHLNTQGWQDIENRIAMREDSLFRIYSMTKIITSVALLTLYERGLLDLNDPIHRYLPGYQKLEVNMPGGISVASNRDITIYDLLRHCSGLQQPPPADELQAGTRSLEQLALEWSTKALIEQPGERWIYGLSSDLLARIVEVVSGKAWDVFLQETIFDPLGMVDSGFFVDDARAERLTICYRLAKEDGLSKLDGNGPESPYRSKPIFLGGGLGLVSSTKDYLRFAMMLLNGGKLGDVNILGRKTVELMTLDHLPKEHPNLSIGTQCFRFGLGVSVVTDIAQTRCLSSLGEFGWGGAAGTQLWINPQENMITMIMIQVRAEVPTGIMDIYKRLVYQALEA